MPWHCAGRRWETRLCGPKRGWPVHDLGARFGTSIALVAEVGDMGEMAIAALIAVAVLLFVIEPVLAFAVLLAGSVMLVLFQRKD